VYRMWSCWGRNQPRGEMLSLTTIDEERGIGRVSKVDGWQADGVGSRAAVFLLAGVQIASWTGATVVGVVADGV
jgi:hypothetical protein